MKKIGFLLLVFLLTLAMVSCAEEPQANDDAPFAPMSVNGTEIAIDAKAAPVLAALGKEQAYEESPSCAFEGMDKLYVYSGFRVKTYSLGGVDYIHSVELTDDSLTTPKGLAIGAGVERVTALYGTPTVQNDSGMQFVFENTTLQVLMRDGFVTNIQYLKSGT